MRAEPSKLAQLVIAYYQKFGRHVPESALRHLGAGELAGHLQDSLANGIPLPETGWGWDSAMSFSPSGCVIVCDGDGERAAPPNGPDGEWLH